MYHLIKHNFIIDLYGKLCFYKLDNFEITLKSIFSIAAPLNVLSNMFNKIFLDLFFCIVIFYFMWNGKGILFILLYFIWFVWLSICQKETKLSSHIRLKVHFQIISIGSYDFFVIIIEFLFPKDFSYSFLFYFIVFCM